MGIEYRVCWTASSNISFHGASDWAEWDDDEASGDDVEEALSEGGGRISDGLDQVLNASGLEWWVETREAA